MSHTTVHAEDIHVEDRQRKDFKAGPLQDLADSILRVGLIHAPVLRENFTLVVGERRLRALALTESRGAYQYGGVSYEYPEIPVHIVPYSDPKLLFEIELEENLRRVNLTAMEEASAIAKLHSVRLEENPQQTRKQTAAEVAEKQGKELNANDEAKVAEALLVEQFKDDPEVQKAAKVSLRKAAKVAKKKMELEFVHAIEGLTDLPPESMNSMYCGRAEEVMPGFADASFDILLFDPPYGIGADKFGEQAMDLGHQYEDDIMSAGTLIEDILREGLRILKPDAHVLMFCAYENFTIWSKLYEAIGYTVWPRPIIWFKGNQAHAPVPDYGPRYSYECILFAWRGRRKINQLINDVLSFPAPRDKIHAAEKPSELLAALINFVARPGDRILDPCAGSGSIFAGGRGKEVFITGIELDANYYAIAKERAKK